MRQYRDKSGIRQRQEKDKTADEAGTRQRQTKDKTIQGQDRDKAEI